MKTSDLLAEDKPVFASLPQIEQEIVRCYADGMTDAFLGGAWALAKEIWFQAQNELTTDQQAACWEFRTDSRERAYLKGEDRKYLQDER
jgi:hypothetical protein